MNPSPKSNPFVRFIFISLFIHLCVTLLMAGIFNQKKTPPPEKKIVFNLKKIKQKPIVDIKKPKSEPKENKNAKTEAVYTQKVKEETVAPSIPVQKKKTTSPSKKKPSKKTAKKNKETKKSISQKKTPSPPKKEPQKIPGMPEAHRGFGPTNQQNNSNYLPGYKIGNRTYLNTQANPNIRYFVELKRKFGLTFNPMPSLRANANRLPSGNIKVILGVSVSSSGQLAGLILIKSSGITAYDNEGRRTVRSSAPFSAPPPNLLAKDGLLHMAWTFIVYR